MATRSEKQRAYTDAVEIAKAAYGSSTGYASKEIAEFLQNTYDKLVELMKDVNEQKL